MKIFKQVDTQNSSGIPFLGPFVQIGHTKYFPNSLVPHDCKLVPIGNYEWDSNILREYQQTCSIQRSVTRFSLYLYFTASTRFECRNIGQEEFWLPRSIWKRRILWIPCARPIFNVVWFLLRVKIGVCWKFHPWK